MSAERDAEVHGETDSQVGRAMVAAQSAVGSLFTEPLDVGFGVTEADAESARLDAIERQLIVAIIVARARLHQSVDDQSVLRDCAANIAEFKECAEDIAHSAVDPRVIEVEQIAASTAAIERHLIARCDALLARFSM